jgi:hypothetical protein
MVMRCLIAWIDRPDIRDPALALVSAMNIVIGVLVAQRVVFWKTIARLFEAMMDEMKSTQLEAFNEVLGLFLKSVEESKNAKP